MKQSSKYPAKMESLENQILLGFYYAGSEALDSSRVFRNYFPDWQANGFTEDQLKQIKKAIKNLVKDNLIFNKPRLNPTLKGFDLIDLLIKNSWRVDMFDKRKSFSEIKDDVKQFATYNTIKKLSLKPTHFTIKPGILTTSNSL